MGQFTALMSNPTGSLLCSATLLSTDIDRTSVRLEKKTAKLYHPELFCSQQATV